MLQQRQISKLLRKTLDPIPHQSNSLSPISISLLSTRGNPLITITNTDVNKSSDGLASSSNNTADQLRIFSLAAYNSLSEDEEWNIIDFHFVKCIIAKIVTSNKAAGRIEFKSKDYENTNESGGDEKNGSEQEDTRTKRQRGISISSQLQLQLQQQQQQQAAQEAQLIQGEPNTQQTCAVFYVVLFYANRQSKTSGSTPPVSNSISGNGSKADDDNNGDASDDFDDVDGSYDDDALAKLKVDALVDAFRVGLAGYSDDYS